MNEGTKKVKLGTDVVNNAEQSFKQIAELVGDASGQIKEISKAIQLLAVSSQQIVLTVKELGKISANTTGQTQTVSAATEEQSASMEQIAANCEDFAQKAEELRSATQKFII